jgi:hypothetical protein
MSASPNIQSLPALAWIDFLAPFTTIYRRAPHFGALQVRCRSTSVETKSMDIVENMT